MVGIMVHIRCYDFGTCGELQGLTALPYTVGIGIEAHIAQLAGARHPPYIEAACLHLAVEAEPSEIFAYLQTTVRCHRAQSCPESAMQRQAVQTSVHQPLVMHLAQSGYLAWQGNGLHRQTGYQVLQQRMRCVQVLQVGTQTHLILL